MRTTRNRGFTLAEVLVASTISGFVAVVAVGALKTIADSAKVVRQASETTGEIRFAARMLARDLTNLYRDPDPQNMKLVGTSQGSDSGMPGSLTFYMAGRSKARPEQPEGDIYEVEYILGNRMEDDTEVTADPDAEAMVLFRRLWPNPDRETTPGGILAPIAENISGFQVLFYDGQQWGDEWTEEMRSIPELIEVTLVTQIPGRPDPILETFMVNFPRMATSSAGSSEGGEASGNEQGPPEPAGEPQGNQSEPGPSSSGGPSNRGR